MTYDEYKEIRRALEQRAHSSKMLVAWECCESLIDAAFDFWADETDREFRRTEAMKLKELMDGTAHFSAGMVAALLISSAAAAPFSPRWQDYAATAAVIEIASLARLLGRSTQ